MQYLRRKYAAEALLDAITGSNQGENVLFLQYLDSLVRLDEFFELLASASQNQLPSLSIVGANKIKTSNDFVTKDLKPTTHPSGILTPFNIADCAPTHT